MLRSLAAASLLRRSICSRRADRRAERIACNSDSCAVRAFAQSSRMRSSNLRCMEHRGPECAQIPTSPKWLFDAIRAFWRKKHPIRRRPKLLSRLGKLFSTRFSSTNLQPGHKLLQIRMLQEQIFPMPEPNCGSRRAFSVLMSKFEEGDWRKLCELVAREPDLHKLPALLQQLTEALNARAKKLDVHSDVRLH
jgi:hypothetical protein